MEQKIYAKFTKERLPQFQIETQIYAAEEKRKIRKRALLPEGQAHINRLRENYELFESLYPGVLAGVTIQDGVAEFEYIQGKSYATCLDECVLAGDKNKFFELLGQYKDFTRKLCSGPVEYENPKETAEIFGTYEELAHTQAGQKVNADLTFDNMICQPDGSMKVIDYEWIFDCVLPLDFPVYRAVFAYYLRSHNELSTLIPMEECREFLGITPQEWQCYEHMNAAFNRYIMGGEKGYGAILHRYAKIGVQLSDLPVMKDEYLQIYTDLGEGYTEEGSAYYPVMINGINNQVEIPLTGKETAIRLDPMNQGGMIALESIYLKKKDQAAEAVTEFETNAVSVENSRYLFLTPDPQFWFTSDPAKEYCAVGIRYQILNQYTAEELEMMPDVRRQREEEEVRQQTGCKAVIKKCVKHLFGNRETEK